MHLVGFSIRIYHDAWSPECQISKILLSSRAGLSGFLNFRMFGLKEFCCMLKILMLTYLFTYALHYEDEQRQRHGGEVLCRQFQHILI